MKNSEAKTTDMQPESEEADVKLDVSVREESVKEEKLSNTNKAAKEPVQEPVTANEHNNANISEQTLNESQTYTKTVQEAVSTESEIISQEKEGISSENISNIEAKEAEDQEENVKLVLDSEQDSVKDREEKPEDKRSKNDKGDELPLVQDELKNGVHEKDEIHSELQTDTESSVEIVESTTSEVSETSESVVQSNIPKGREKVDETLNDASFISYDSSIMLKDVQVKLNDCLKDNSKLFDVSNVEETPSQLLKESFGMTLRNISGRHSISRMRHLGFHEKRISPNSSLFVNTSTISIPQDEEAKVLQYSSALSESLPTNGSSLDRKRKTDTLIWSSTKKQKTEVASGLLSTPMSLLRGLHRPIQVSTPNVTPYKYESTKLDISGMKDDDNKITAESTESTKKWCVIM